MGSKVHVRNLVALEGRLLEQGGQTQAVGTDLAALQRKMEEEKGDVQVRGEGVRNCSHEQEQFARRHHPLPCALCRVS